jgi:hypothetical protein
MINILLAIQYFQLGKDNYTNWFLQSIETRVIEQFIDNNGQTITSIRENMENKYYTVGDYICLDEFGHIFGIPYAKMQELIKENEKLNLNNIREGTKE